MVTPPHNRLHALALTAALSLALAAAFSALAPPARGQSETLYFLTVKSGVQNPGGDTLFHHLEAAHGPLQGERQVHPVGVELDIYGVSDAGAGLALGVEVHRYEQTFRFRDPAQVLPPEDVTLTAQGVLFTLKAFLRYGIFFPFLGAGLGNYYVNYREDTTGLALREAADQVYTVRGGFRLLLGRLGLLLEAGQTWAPVELGVPLGTRSTLELGGTYANAGVSWLF